MDAKEELLDYLPFGTIRIDQKAGDYSDQRKFAGHEYDNDTGLSYMNARYYDGATGRFISQDPAFLAVGDNERIKSITDKELVAYLSDPQGFNGYAYANNNPLKYIDATGESPLLLPYLAAAAPALAASIMAYAPQIMTYGQSYIQALWTPVGQVTMSQAINDVNQGRYDWAAVGLITSGKNPFGQSGKMSQYVSKIIPNISRNSLPSYAKNTLNLLEKNGFKNPIRGYKGGGIFQNDKTPLPPKNDPGYYREWDVKPLQTGINRGAERMVTGKNGEVYWTNNHYQTFYKIK